MAALRCVANTYLVLCGVAHQALGVGEGHIGGRGAVTCSGGGGEVQE